MAESREEYENQYRIYSMLLIDLQRMNVTDATKSFLMNLITVAEVEIAREGITLDLSETDDRQTIEMYAAYLYRKRVSGDGMPRMLRYRLNNRLLSERMGP